MKTYTTIRGSFLQFNQTTSQKRRTNMETAIIIIIIITVGVNQVTVVDAKTDRAKGERVIGSYAKKYYSSK